MALKDKLAFAAIHMDDDALAAALDKLVGTLLAQRPLSALFVVGLDDQTESHKVLHRLDSLKFAIIFKFQKLIEGILISPATFKPFPFFSRLEIVFENVRRLKRRHWSESNPLNFWRVRCEIWGGGVEIASFIYLF